MNDVKAAKKYLSKANSAKTRGLEFDISFAEYKSLIHKKKCFFTGIDVYPSDGISIKTNTLTIDRIDSRLGYVSGNCVACSDYFNNLKAVIENDSNDLGFKDFIKGAEKLKKVLRR